MTLMQIVLRVLLWFLLGLLVCLHFPLAVLGLLLAVLRLPLVILRLLLTILGLLLAVLRLLLVVLRSLLAVLGLLLAILWTLVRSIQSRALGTLSGKILTREIVLLGLLGVSSLACHVGIGSFLVRLLVTRLAGLVRVRWGPWILRGLPGLLLLTWSVVLVRLRRGSLLLRGRRLALGPSKLLRLSRGNKAPSPGADRLLLLLLWARALAALWLLGWWRLLGTFRLGGDGEGRLRRRHWRWLGGRILCPQRLLVGRVVVDGFLALGLHV